MSFPIVIDIEVTSPAQVELELAAPIVDVTPDPDGAQVVVVATPGPVGPRGEAGEGTRVVNETPSGAKDGTNTVFALANTPRIGSTTLYCNGLRESIGDGYIESGSNIIFSTPPLASDVLIVDYLMEG